ncbi:MAG: hypothetical protein J3K34DRAFT_469827 [Monoraphidium minutum]|nr:MAG: hypothetical protein J3K34DRAFT_469827 [Monoraphidium minutum]
MRGCVRCSTGNKIVSADGRKCVKCPRRTIPREASAVVCVCAAGVADDGSCGSCLPGFGAAPAARAAAPGNAGCVCSAAGQVWDAATNKCVPGVVPPDPSGPGAGKFNIQLVNMGTDASQDAAYQARRGPRRAHPHEQKAKARWEAALAAVDLPGVANPSAIDLARGLVPGYTNTQPFVDDIVIMYGSADLPNKLLGRAGPTWNRDDGSDFWDFANIAEDGGDQNYIDAIILHEMGDCKAGSNADNRWQCYHANHEYAAMGFTGNVPIETAMGEGAGCQHWSEAVLKQELMTPVIDGPSNPLLRVTLGALEDIYGSGLVDYAQADAFNVSSVASAGVSASVSSFGGGGGGGGGGAAPTNAAAPANGGAPTIGAAPGGGGAPAEGSDVLRILPLPFNGGRGLRPPTPGARAAIDAALAAAAAGTPGPYYTPTGARGPEWGGL